MAPVAWGQIVPEPRTLSGNVYYAGGNQTVENLSVELRTTEGSLVATQTTTSTGWFEFRGVQRGVFVIAINSSGYEPVNFNVDLTFSSSRGNAIYLRKLSDGLQKVTDAKSVSAHELSMPQKVRDLVESGKKKLYGSKDAQGALADFQKAILAAPGFYEVHYQIAMAQITLGEKDGAEKSLRKAIEISRDTFGEADIGLGTVMLDRADFAEGEKMIRRGVELSPDVWLGHYELGRALMNENRFDEAEQEGVLARTLAPRAAIIYRLLSNVHLHKENYPALLEDIDAYLALDPDSPAAIRAKEIRDEVRRKIGAKKAPLRGGPTPGNGLTARKTSAELSD